MHSFLLISPIAEKRKNYIQSFCAEKNIGNFDQRIIEPLDASFGVELVKNVQKTALLKPSQSKDKVLILEDAQKLTTEAQNALLKLLEEPPAHTYVFLSATTDAYFLPTIVSRCKKIQLAEEKKDISNEKREEIEKAIALLENGSLGEKMVLAEKLSANKENLSGWLQDSILLLRERMILEFDNAAHPKLLAKFQSAYQLFQTTNVAPRMVLEHTFLEL